MFSKAPKRKGNLAVTTGGKRVNTNQVTKARFSFGKHVHGFYASRHHAQVQPVIFVTIDHTLAEVTPDSPMSAKADTAKKMFSAYND